MQPSFLQLLVLLILQSFEWEQFVIVSMLNFRVRNLLKYEFDTNVNQA